VQRLLRELAAAEAAVAGLAQLERRISSLGRQLAEIEKRDGRSQVENAQADLRSVRFELWTTEDVARLPELDDRLDGVEDEIASLWARPPKFRLHSTGVPATIRLGPVPAPDPVVVARHDVRVVRTVEGVVVLVAALVAVVTALGTLYVGKPFGTGWDYLAL